MKILVLGATGMLGNALFRYLSKDASLDVWAAIRAEQNDKLHQLASQGHLIGGMELSEIAYEAAFNRIRHVKPDVIINAVGLVKQEEAAKDPLKVIPVNALLPHRLVKLCEDIDARLIHMSTDCVFSGAKGMYHESDIADATDLYGRTKLIGEVDKPYALTLRTSILGHELYSQKSLVDWFLSQQGSVDGYQKAVFSGLPTVEIARIIHQYVLPNAQLHGLYHVSAEPINKYDLLKEVSRVYSKHIEILPNTEFKIDRSLDSSKFRQATGFVPKSWPEMIQIMHDFH
ncbi:MAG: hypothetical protein RL297_119 [Pseudomonadota bacterium]|jgi:dTDP-4-dehydrorhamnose reductase